MAASAIEDFASRGTAHSLAETKDIFSAALARLEGAFHGLLLVERRL